MVMNILACSFALETLSSLERLVENVLLDSEPFDCGCPSLS